MTTSEGTSLKRQLLFGAAGLAAGGLTLWLARAGDGRFFDVPEFLLFLRRLGWTLIAAAAVWEAIATTKLLLHIADMSSRAERPRP